MRDLHTAIFWIYLNDKLVSIFYGVVHGPFIASIFERILNGVSLDRLTLLTTVAPAVYDRCWYYLNEYRYLLPRRFGQRVVDNRCGASSCLW